VEELIRLARSTGVRLLIRHISSAAGAGLIAGAQREGLEVYGETCPHYLYFDESVYQRENGADFIVHPPIRRAEDREGIWKALESGVKFTIGTDDCAFYLRQKRVSDKFYEVPGGLPGIETRLPVLYELGVSQKRIGVERLAELTAETPAKLYGLYPQKGCLKVGSDGDVVLLRTDVEEKIMVSKLHEKTDYTPFEGVSVHARVEATVSNGRIVVRLGKDRAVPGEGKFLRRALSASAMIERG
jgi:dihydropyrimidinase